MSLATSHTHQARSRALGLHGGPGPLSAGPGVVPLLDAELAARARRQQLLDGRAVLAGAARGAAVVVVVVGGGRLLAQRAHLAERGLRGWMGRASC